MQVQSIMQYLNKENSTSVLVSSTTRFFAVSGIKILIKVIWYGSCCIVEEEIFCMLVQTIK